MEEQLRFDLSARPALGREAFFVSEANATALAMIDAVETWPNGKLLLSGPAGAGKTHLAHVWAAAVGGRIVSAQALASTEIEDVTRAPLCVEDIDQIAGHLPAETALFHTHNLLLAEGRPLLMTARGVPKDWAMDLPDLLSRVQGTSLTRIDPPDEALLGALFGKLFADRQLGPNPDVIPYLARHAPRAFEIAQHLVEELDTRAMAEGRPITRALARDVLGALS